MTKAVAEERDRSSAPRYCLWIISEGSPGHISQSKGLAEAIQSISPVRIHQVEVRQKGRGGWRWVFRGLFRLAPRLRPLWVRLCASCESLPTDIPDLLIASGGKSVFYSRYLADRFHVPLVFCGSPGAYPADWFAGILSTELPVVPPGNWIHTDILLNPVTPEVVKSAAVERPLPQQLELTAKGRIGLVLIGGRSRSQLFEKTDWLALAAQLNLLAEREGWRWLVVTSRRTGASVEALLEGALDHRHLLDAVWWSKDPRKVVRAYLGHAEVVLVGRDSMTMISEAVCSGRPVVVFGPEKTAPSNLIDGFLENLIAKELILNRPCAALAADFGLSKELMSMRESPVPSYAKKIIELLATKKSAQP